jgi:hypothetical protein
MTFYSVALVAGLAALAGRGFPGAAAGVGLFVSVVAASLDAGYVASRRKERVLGHRRRLDRIVRRQWLAVATLSTGIAVGVSELDQAPLDPTDPFVRAVVVAVVVCSVAIYISSLIDWYWLLPRISGLVGPAPCERVGTDRFAGITRLWLLHRAAAALVVTFALVGLPGYVAASTHGTATVAWIILGSALAIGYSSVTRNAVRAFRHALNPRIRVGDLIRVRVDPEDATLQDAYVVDVSLQGCRYKSLADIKRPCPTFLDKGQLLSIDEMARTRRSRHPTAPCPNVASCRAVNWYCFRNRQAHTFAAFEDLAPAPWDSGSEVVAPQGKEATLVSSVPRPRRVFISHALAERAMAQEIARDLQGHGLAPLVAPEATASLGTLTEDTARQIARADAFILLLSANSQQSQRARLEVSAVLKRVWADPTTTVVPVLVGSVDPPGYLRDKPTLRVEPNGHGTAEALLRYLLDQPVMSGVRRTDAGDTRLERRLAELESTAASLAEEDQE